jgi:membrane-bound lytic murein transglycosylase D
MQSDLRDSSRDSNIVRSAVDVVVLGGGPGYGYASYSGDNLWGRVRARMDLGISSNSRVDKEIRRLRSNPMYLEQLSARAAPYMHLIVHEIERRRLPGELALLPEIESKYNPTALSHKSASGMWQFIPDTGRKYGLKQNAWYDGRNDIVASTHAALDYLQWLHREFRGDWALALAGYNAGEKRVAAEIRKNRGHGKGTDFWALDLPTETKNYVPKLVAVAKLVEKPQRFGMRAPHIPDGPRLKLVDMGRQTNLARAAKLSGVRLADLRRLNAGLKRGTTLPSGPHKLLFPIGSGRTLRGTAHRSQRHLKTVAQTGSGN